MSRPLGCLALSVVLLLPSAGRPADGETSRNNLAARRRKALGCPGLAAWLGGGGRFILHGWAKVGARGSAEDVAVR